MAPLSRRSFLASGAAAGIMASLPGTVYAQASTKANALTLRAVRRTIEVDGRAASVLGLVDGTGRPGLILDPGQRFRVDLTNDLDVETIVHWYGQIPPNAQDGVSNTSPMIPAGGSRSFDFAPRTGTFWMHSHVPAQEVDQLAAPLIVRSAEDLAADRQEVVLFLHDFSFRSGEEVLEEITSGRAMPHGEVQEGSHSMGEFPWRIVGHHESDPMSMPMPNAMSGGMAGMGHDSGMEMDRNDFEFDAYLANDRTLDDPEVIAVERGGRVLLRAINAASMTAFWIDLGSVVGRLVAVDGDAVEPMEGTRFGFAQGQRLDIEIDMPADGSVLPVLALREGASQRTGIVLAPRGAEVRRISSTADAEHPAYSGDMTTELALRALNPLPDRPVNRTHMVMLGGQMSPYVWSLNGQLWGSHTPVAVMSGERVESGRSDGNRNLSAGAGE